jgi:hypothetical protein
MNLLTRIVPGVALAALAAAAPATVAAQAGNGDEGPFLIRGATVVTVTGPRMQNTDVMIRDGVIAEIGRNLQAPAGIMEFDASGMFVYPGMMDGMTSIGLSDIGSVQTMNLTSELGEFNPNNRALVALNVETQMIPITRANGVTHVLTAPGGGVMPGQAAVINLEGWTWEDVAVNSSAAFMINYPNLGGGGGRGGFGGRGGGGGQRAQEAINELKELLRTARAYDEMRSGDEGEFNLKLESMRPLVRGETLALVSANSEEQIEGAIMLADSFGLKVAVLGGDEAWKLRQDLAQKNIPVVLGSIQSTPSGDSPYDAIYAQPGILRQAGVKIAFSTGGSSSSRHLPYHAALAVAYDLDPDDALRALTLWPAEIFGIADQVGSVEVGKRANLFIADGDPLDVRTHMLEVFIDGKRIPHDDRHFLLYEKWNGRPAGR